MRISDLEGRQVALWGFGREGRAAWGALRRRFPQQRLTVFCPEPERAAIDSLHDPLLTAAGAPTAEALAGFDVVIRSPGISRYSPLAEQASAKGATFTSGTALWFAEELPGRRICVTGSKGKSTTSALIAHLLRAAGHRVGLAGNIGLPLLELLEPPVLPDIWVIELSSFQTADARAPDVALVLNLYPEHLDWHGTETRYYADKLTLVEQAAPRRAVLNARDHRLQAFARGRDGIDWFDEPQGWHLRDEWLFRGDQPIMDTRGLPLPGQHNRVNLCAALAAIEALGIDARELARHAEGFRPLPHRLQPLGTRDGITCVDDSISTTPHASLAALDCFRGQRVAIIVGGFDRGLDWQVFADRVAGAPPVAIVTTGQNGPRIFDLLQRTAFRGHCTLRHADDLGDAVAFARESLDGNGVLLLSPGAPSFPTFRDYAERGRVFAREARFDDAIDAIGGLGIS